MVRDEELKRLIRYAQGMGISVRFRPYKPHSGDAAEWDDEAQRIVVFVSTYDTKLNKILRLIHEIGHAKGFIRNGRRGKVRVTRALEAEKPTRVQRKLIYQDEAADAKLWDEIYQDAGCTFHINKLRRRQAYDVWIYRQFYLTGRIPREIDCARKRRELNQLYPC
jgi:hypothetical protein